MKTKLINWLVRYLTKNLLVAVTKEDVLTMTNRGWAYKGRRLSPEEVTQLKEEARTFGDSLLWRLMTQDIRYIANTSMFEKGVDRESTIFGRAMLYNLQILEDFITRSKQL